MFVNLFIEMNRHKFHTSNKITSERAGGHLNICNAT